MGLDFLRENGARRVRDFAPQPMLLGDGVPLSPSEDNCLDLSYETPKESWQPHAVQLEGGQSDETWPNRPSRFVDGKDVGRTIAWLQSREGYPVPVRLSEIGAVALRAVETPDGERALRREWNKVERVVSFMADLFPWDEVEEFAIGLQGSGFRLLPVRGVEESDDEAAATPDGFDFERMRQKTSDRTKDEMIRLEREALSCALDAATIVDGGLDARSSAFAPTEPVIGLIKTHSKNYLHTQGWRTFYELKPGQRTPAFALNCRNVDVISWYLRMDGARGELPNWGVVRVEVPQTFFETAEGQDWEYLDRVSRLICDYRCRDQSYGRSAVTIHPIQRAEQSLGALFTQSDVLISRFYHLTNL